MDAEHDDDAAPHAAEHAAGGGSQRALVEQVAERVYQLMRAELRLERARGGGGGASAARTTRD